MIFNDAATGAGLMAGAIAVGGFLAHAPRALRQDSDEAVRSATVVGGLAGFAAAGIVIAFELLS
jgi:hypothetical protein